MRNLLITFLGLPLIFLASCEYSGIEVQNDDLNIEIISKSKSFELFKISAENFNSPFIKKLNALTKSEKVELNNIINALSNKSKVEISKDEYRELILKMGYSGIEDYERKNLKFMQSLQSLIDKYPKIQDLTVQDRREFFIKLFRSELEANKKSIGQISISNCAYDYRYCMEMAKGTYIAGTGVCAVGLLGGPIGGVGALLCQLANTAVYEGAKQDCLHSYNNCS